MASVLYNEMLGSVPDFRAVVAMSMLVPVRCGRHFLLLERYNIPYSQFPILLKSAGGRLGMCSAAARRPPSDASCACLPSYSWCLRLQEWPLSDGFYIPSHVAWDVFGIPPCRQCGTPSSSPAVCSADRPDKLADCLRGDPLQRPSGLNQKRRTS